jgi:hypothetical protein
MAKRKVRRKRRAFTPELKAEAVRLCKVADCTIPQVAEALHVRLHASFNPSQSVDDCAPAPRPLAEGTAAPPRPAR